MVASLQLFDTIVGIEEHHDMEVMEMLLLFDKNLLPSDMCRFTEFLEIPGEHAWKLGNMVKGREGFFVVFFQDSVVPGKLWRFRSVYKNKIKIPGLSKGWGCFVREKGLTAGDTISFFRGSACQRLFICRKSGAQARVSSATMLPHCLSVPPPSTLAYNSQVVGLGTGTLARDVASSGQERLHVSNASLGHADAQTYCVVTPSTSHYGARKKKPMTEKPPILESTPPILESMFVVAPPPAVKTLQFLGVNINVLPLYSCGQSKQESH